MKDSTLHHDSRLSIQFQHVMLKTSQITHSTITTDSNQLYLLLTDASKLGYSGVLTQASIDESNKGLIKLLTDNDPLKSVHSQTWISYWIL